MSFDIPLSQAKNKVVFLDRDGTIARDVPYCSRVEDFKLFPGVAEGARLLGDKGLPIIVITNQSGIARGYFSEATLAEIHRSMKETFAGFGVDILDAYYCPHHPDDGCDCRKPEPGMILQAAREHAIDLENSFFVGDSRMDVAAGRRAGCRTVLISAAPEDAAAGEPKAEPDYVAGDFLDACRWIAGKA